MTFTVNAAINGFGRSQVVIDNPTTGSIADAAFSSAGDVVQFTNTERSPNCVMVMRCQFATVPASGTIINIYARKMNIFGTNDSPVPNVNNLDQIIGHFTINSSVATNTDAYLPTNWMTLPDHFDAQVYEFYFQNLTGQTITGAWSVLLSQVTIEAKI